MVVDGLLRPHRRRHRLALLQPPERLGEHLGLPKEIVVHDLLDVLLGELGLVRGDRLTGDRRRREDSDQSTDREETDLTHRSF